jgi:hypothetical protein
MYAANQEVNTAKSPQTVVDVAANRVLNISSVQDSKSVQMKFSPSGGNIQNINNSLWRFCSVNFLVGGIHITHAT